MNEELYDLMHKLLGDRLFQLIINPVTNRPLTLRSLKQKQSYKQLSGGEHVLVHFAYDIFNGTGRLNISNLYFLDDSARKRVLTTMEHYLKIHRP